VASELSASQVVYPARAKANLDWETMNKLCEESEDFRSFLQSVKIDVNARKVHREEFDRVIKDIEAYAQRLQKGEGTDRRPDQVGQVHKPLKTRS
jgi:hypothetical protein